ncbi:MAG: DegV family protein [Tissierellia bacterium]|nr:DegV family protein [Tissierellia bacterium]
MSKIALVCDSAFDLPLEYMEKHSIYRIPFSINFPDESILDGNHFDREDFFERMRKDLPKTAVADPDRIRRVLQKIRKEGIRDVIMMSVSSALSGMHNAMRLMAMEEEDMNIELFDTKTASIASGLYMVYAQRLVERGLTFQEICSKLREKMGNAKIYVYFKSVENMIRSGRVPKLRGAIASVLRISPILTSDEEGKIALVQKVRGDKNGVKALREILNEKLDQMKEYYFSVGYSRYEKDGDVLESEFAQEIKDASYYQKNSLTPALAVHGGEMVYLVSWLEVE